jgi:hypothetical protein
MIQTINEFSPNDFTNLDYDIRILINSKWIPALNHQINGFLEYKKRNKYIENSSYSYIYQNKNIRISRGTDISFFNDSCYEPLYLICDNIYYPIIDFSSIKVFLLDLQHVNWYRALSYQSWAYIDFIYSNDISRTYASYGSNINNYVGPVYMIPIFFCNIPNVIFRMLRNENSSIYYERNDSSRTRIRISDSELAMASYYNYYQRLTNDIEINFTISEKNNIKCNKTNDEEKQCIICNDNEKDIILDPCSHNIMCNECYENLKIKKCPICRTSITHIYNKL